MLDFTAIDFETANKYANSACSLAAVTMHDDICTDEAYTLIKPPFMVCGKKFDHALQEELLWLTMRYLIHEFCAVF